jgi:hypothetical protein
MGKFDNISLKPSDFAHNVSTHTILTGPQLNRLFKTKEEKQAFLDLLTLIEAKTSENEKTAELIKNIGKYAGVAIKLARKAALGV